MDPPDCYKVGAPPPSEKPEDLLIRNETLPNSVQKLVMQHFSFEARQDLCTIYPNLVQLERSTPLQLNFLQIEPHSITIDGRQFVLFREMNTDWNWFNEYQASTLRHLVHPGDISIHFPNPRQRNFLIEDPPRRGDFYPHLLADGFPRVPYLPPYKDHTADEAMKRLVCHLLGGKPLIRTNVLQFECRVSPAVFRLPPGLKIRARNLIANIPITGLESVLCTNSLATFQTSWLHPTNFNHPIALSAKQLILADYYGDIYPYHRLDLLTHPNVHFQIAIKVANIQHVIEWCWQSEKGAGHEVWMDAEEKAEKEDQVYMMCQLKERFRGNRVDVGDSSYIYSICLPRVVDHQQETDLQVSLIRKPGPRRYTFRLQIVPQNSAPIVRRDFMRQRMQFSAARKRLYHCSFLSFQWFICCILGLIFIPIIGCILLVRFLWKRMRRASCTPRGQRSTP